MTIAIHRGVGHPWNGDGEWDRLSIQCHDGDALESLVAEAERKFWRVWIRDQHHCSIVMYKPSGAQATWEDEPRMGTPRELCLSIQIGDLVWTSFTGRITEHRVTARETSAISQTGTRLRVTPVVEKSADAGNVFVGSNPWMDAAWFRPAILTQSEDARWRT